MADCVTLGSDYVVELTYRDANNALSTPTVYELDYLDASDNQSTITQGNIDNPSTGVLRVGIPTDEVGAWSWRMTATVSGGQLVTSGTFCVKTDGGFT